VSAAAKPTGPPATTRGANGKLQGYFSEEQVEALIVARSTVPSNAPKYWETIASMVPGQTPETCKAMAYQIAFDKVRTLAQRVTLDMVPCMIARTMHLMAIDLTMLLRPLSLHLRTT
jgi:hypothetical protein